MDSFEKIKVSKYLTVRLNNETENSSIYLTYLFCSLILLVRVFIRNLNDVFIGAM